MERRIGIAIESTGLSIALVSLALAALGVKIPHALAYFLLVLAGIALVGGWVFGFRGGWLKSLVGEYKFQLPIVRKANIPSQPVSKKNKNKNLQGVSDNIVKNIQSVTEQLEKVSAGANSCSIKQIFNDILRNNTFNAWYRNKPLLIQLGNLFNWQLDQLFDRSAKCREKSKSFSIDDFTEIYRQIGALTFNYRSIISEFIQLLNNLEKEGAPTVWEDEPLWSKIYQELQDDYDKLMQRIENLKVYVPNEAKPLLPSDDQLKKFDRIPGVVMS